MFACERGKRDVVHVCVCERRKRGVCVRGRRDVVYVYGGVWRCVCMCGNLFPGLPYYYFKIKPKNSKNS